MAWRVLWVRHPEHDPGKQKPCWGKLGAELVWGTSWLRPPWKNASGLKLPNNRSHSPTDLTQTNRNQLVVLVVTELDIDLFGKARSRNRDVVPAHALGDPLGVLGHDVATPGVRTSAKPVGMQQPCPPEVGPDQEGGALANLQGEVCIPARVARWSPTEPVPSTVRVVAAIDHERDGRLRTGCEGGPCRLDTAQINPGTARELLGAELSVNSHPGEGRSRPEPERL